MAIKFAKLYHQDELDSVVARLKKLAEDKKTWHSRGMNNSRLKSARAKLQQTLDAGSDLEWEPDRMDKDADQGSDRDPFSNDQSQDNDSFVVHSSESEESVDKNEDPYLDEAREHQKKDTDFHLKISEQEVLQEKQDEATMPTHLKDNDLEVMKGTNSAAASVLVEISKEPSVKRKLWTGEESPRKKKTVAVLNMPPKVGPTVTDKEVKTEGDGPGDLTFDECIASGPEMVARKSKVPLLLAFNFIFVCCCPFCCKKEIREAKTMEYSRETFCKAKEGVQLKQQHVVLDKYGFVLYDHLLPQGNATRGTHTRLRVHLCKKNGPNFNFPECA